MKYGLFSIIVAASLASSFALAQSPLAPGAPPPERLASPGSPPKPPEPGATPAPRSASETHLPPALDPNKAVTITLGQLQALIEDQVLHEKILALDQRAKEASEILNRQLQPDVGAEKAK